MLIKKLLLLIIDCFKILYRFCSKGNLKPHQYNTFCCLRSRYSSQTCLDQRKFTLAPRFPEKSEYISSKITLRFLVVANNFAFQKTMIDPSKL